MTRALIVGYGSIGARYAGLLVDLGVDVAVVSRREINFPHRYKELGKAVEEWRPNVAIIASKTVEHRSDIERLARHGYQGAVLVEKPLYDRPASTPDIQSSRVHVAFNLRFHPVIQEMREQLKGRTIYSLHAYVGQYLPDWRPGNNYTESYSAKRAEGGGVIRDLCHEIDLILWLAGPHHSMTALGGKVSDLEIDSDDVFTLLLELEKAPVATLVLNYLDSVRTRELVVHTDKGTLRGDLCANTLINDTLPKIYFTMGANDTYKAQLKAFLAGDETTLCSLKEGMAVTNLIAKAEQASQERIWLR